MEDGWNQASESGVLDKLRRHIRILVDIGRLSGENPDLDRFLDQTVLQIARGVEIHHVKVLQYRPETSPPGRGSRMKGRWRSHRYVLGRPTFTAWAGISNRRAGKHQKFQRSRGIRTLQFPEGAWHCLGEQRACANRWCGMGRVGGRQYHPRETSPRIPRNFSPPLPL